MTALSLRAKEQGLARLRVKNKRIRFPRYSGSYITRGIGNSGNKASRSRYGAPRRAAGGGGGCVIDQRARRRSNTLSGGDACGRTRGSVGRPAPLHCFGHGRSPPSRSARRAVDAVYETMSLRGRKFLLTNARLARVTARAARPRARSHGVSLAR
ncbi:hypothetical protein EVAR_80441_1 [Eumeta japonica]|uniref:Uncharacterized protein n=1 Tax=Eumeta variegata TaxID=151549 RepID=A0A4C1VGU8_EUMVA|nr:hypothetical protein EVAR_80441_1 [Eumeta japonica]